jgi:hypothetical protein
MTPVTLQAETSFMLVILLVAIDTDGRCFDLLVHVCTVAGVTIEPLMAAVELESSPRIVIEVPEFPVS